MTLQVASNANQAPALFTKYIAPIEHTPRTYASEGYVLPSDEQERQRLLFSLLALRLVLQHNVLKAAFGNRVLLAPLPAVEDLKVLECGTGSGIWLLDLATELKGNFHGFDIESRLFPRNAPGNLFFTMNSVTRMPEWWAESYGLVHQRLLLAALNAYQWKEAINEMYRVLIPGGSVQLGEAGPWKSGSVTEKHQTLVQNLFESRGLLLDCAVHIPQMLSNAGFIEIKTEVKTIPLGRWAGQTGIDGRDNFMGVFRGMKTPVLKMGGLGFVQSEAEFDRLLDEVEVEWDATPGSEIEFFIFTAQKPLSSAL
ncbi:hypothetical protein M422DRAFT_173752 [Sphaerobolus stellatus SS14]|uniref:Methyltransferase domain-containing protein n=1 Tax=Sphaerobolus stellatus (strain SS14) TaxID=990650 RepID=A0A0C9VQF6_SPHS4|nr:hypothetical protein M422DRAFT_173752 [Sphaerobolus stellatus SS14]